MNAPSCSIGSTAPAEKQLNIDTMPLEEQARNGL